MQQELGSGCFLARGIVKQLQGLTYTTLGYTGWPLVGDETTKL